LTPEFFTELVRVRHEAGSGKRNNGKRSRILATGARAVYSPSASGFRVYVVTAGTLQVHHIASHRITSHHVALHRTAHNITPHRIASPRRATHDS
jgi:hypothetical protein